MKTEFFRALCLGLLLAPLLQTADAGRYPVSGVQAFTYADGTTNFADGTALTTSFSAFAKVSGNTLQLANKTYSGNSSCLRFPNLDPGNAVQSLDAAFMVRMSKTSATAQPGSGWSLNFGAVPATGNGSGDIGFAMPGGLVLSFDTFPNTANDTPSIEIYCNNVSVGNFPAGDLNEVIAITGGTFTLTNPVTGGTTGNISYAASASALQTAMRSVSGWSGVVVTGTAGAWTVTMPAAGSYATPTGNGSLLTAPVMTPGQGRVTVTNTQDGTATSPEVWTIAREGRGFIFDAGFRALEMHWDYDGLDLTYGGQVIFTNLPTPGFAPASGNTFAFSATASGGSQDTFIDDLVITSSPASPPDTGGPVISEFMAENKNTLEDEDMDTPDWIEIYNGQNAAVNLSGYSLTDGVAVWTFPSVNLPAYGHLVVLASGKNRTANPALLHTNFTLPKTGGALSLRNPANTVVSNWTYPAQVEDVSYGLRYQGGATGFLSPVSPGAATLYNYFAAPNGPAEDVIFSREGGIITGSVAVSVTAPAAPGSVVRYTLDNTIPSAASPVFPPTLTVSTSTNVRARVFTPGYLPGPVSSRTFLLIDGSLSNYNGSGQPFQSHLPVIVMDSFGQNVDAVTDSAQPRPHRFTYSVVIDKSPGGFASITSPVVDFQGRGGTHVRGDSSSGFAQKSYAWETWDNNNDDKDASILGMPAESDWALHGPYTDKTFLRNYITYSRMRELHGGANGFAMRVKLVEVIYNQDSGQAVSYNDYRGVYVLMERIKRGNNRIDIAKLNSLVTDPALITGGYIFRRDRTSADGNTPLPVGMHSHTPNALNTAQTNWLTNHLNAFNNALNGASFADPVLGYEPYIDVNSFIENWWFVEIMKQIDGYRLSTYFYKDRGGKIKASPLWDYNLSLGNADYATGDQPTGWYWNQTDSYWWARLRQDPNYELRNWDRYWELRRGIFDTAAMNAYIDGLVNQVLNGSTTPVTNSMPLAAGQPSTVENAAMRHYRKYPVLGTYLWPNGAGYASRTFYNSNGNATTGEIDWMKNWLAQRLIWIDNQNFSGTVIYRPPVFSLAGGSVPAGSSLTISRYTGTPPGGYTYAGGGTIYYTLDGSDPRASAPPVVENALISGSADACQWLVPSAGNGGLTLTAGSGPEQWTNYTAPVNSASWTSAVTGIGYDLNPDYLPLIGAGGNTQSQMQGINATCYLRVPFTIPNQATLDAISTLRLSMKYDDGFRAYINGVAVAGGNDTHASMATNPATAQAPSARDEAAAVTFETFDISGSGIPALRVGANVLAIHCLNGVDSTSSDLIMVPKLTWSPVSSGGGGGQVYTGPVTLTSSATVRARLFANNVWSPIMTANYIVDAVPASAANLVISEIHYHPADATTDEINAGFGSASDFEFIELFNVSSQNVNLSDCRFTDGVTYEFGSVDPALLTLAPQGRAIVVANLAAFSYRYGVLPGVRILGAYAGNLRNSGELLTLLAANGSVIASFTFGTVEPWPVDGDGPGYSLLLNNPAAGADYEDGSSWRSSAQTGGSPGGANAAAFTGLISGDSDQDGMSDFLEYAMGSSYSSPSSVPILQHSLITDPPGAAPGVYLSYQYRRNLNADGVMLTPQQSTDLGSWSGAGIVYMSTQNMGDGTALVSCRSADPVGGPGLRSYMRVVVSPAP